MKKIALSALLVLSSAAFAGGRNASGPQNPPNPPTPEVVQQSRICGEFYESNYPGLNREESNLPTEDGIVTIIPNTSLHIVANVACVFAGPVVAMEHLCLTARAKGWSCVTGADWTFTRPDVP